MADIVVTPAQVGAVYPNGISGTTIMDMIAVEAITKGQAVYQTTAGKAGVADANAAGKQQFRGIALEAASAGGVVPVLVTGAVYGFTVSGEDGDAVLFLSDTAGALADAAGTMTVHAGRVIGLPDGNNTKAFYVQADWLRTWS